MDFKVYIMLFFLYSFIGWLIEVVASLINLRKFVNRGFFIGPYCPIYGTGGVLVTFLLSNYIDKPVGLFCISIFIISILEYFTSYFMEKMFNARWWDYSQKKFNINGRICLETMIPFGILGLVMMYLINPLLFKYINMFSDNILLIVIIILVVLFVVDIILTLKTALEIKKTVVFEKKKDNTQEITKHVRDILTKRKKATKRLMLSFPTFNASKFKKGDK